MSRAIFKSFIFLILSFALTAQPIVAASKIVKVEVAFVSAELVENNHVGNEWSIIANVNGIAIAEGAKKQFNLKETESVKIEATAVEQDKYPDVGSTDKSIKVSAIANKETSQVLYVTVTENRGRYAGNTVKWKFVFKVKKV